MTDPAAPPVVPPGVSTGAVTGAAGAPHGAPRVKSISVFTCPGCGGQIELRAAGASLTAVCAHCGAVVDVSDEKLKVVQQAHAAKMETVLEIGARGKLGGATWEVIGYTLKADKTGVYFWDEYLLFNPYNGFRFLIQQDGHWSFVRIIKDEIQRSSFFNNAISFDGHGYRPFLQDNPVVKYVKGEFYWRVKKGDAARTEDFVHPPRMLSFEYTDGDMTVSLCDYVEPSVISSAFTLSLPMPHRKNVAPNQPNPHEAGPLFVVGSLAASIALAIHIMTAATAPAAQIYDMTRTHLPGDQIQTFTSDVLQIPAETNILAKSWARVDNQWAELGLSLENEATGQTYDLRQPIEYYHGYDSDGAWSEGGLWAENYFSGVPPGAYRLTYDVDSGLFAQGQPVDIGIKLTRGVVPWGNLLFTLAFLLLWPCVSLLRKGSFESKRWENSDFATS